VFDRSVRRSRLTFLRASLRSLVPDILSARNPQASAGRQGQERTFCEPATTEPSKHSPGTSSLGKSNLANKAAERHPKMQRLSNLGLRALIFFSLVTLAFSQSDPTLGLQTFGSERVSAYDSIDVKSSRVLITIPVRDKTGKIPVSFKLLDNSHAWYDGGWAVSTAFVATLFAADLGLSGPFAYSYCGEGGNAFPESQVSEVTGAVHNTALVNSQCITSDGSGYTIDSNDSIKPACGSTSALGKDDVRLRFLPFGHLQPLDRAGWGLDADKQCQWCRYVLLA